MNGAIQNMRDVNSLVGRNSFIHVAKFRAVLLIGIIVVLNSAATQPGHCDISSLIGFPGDHSFYSHREDSPKQNVSPLAILAPPGFEIYLAAEDDLTNHTVAIIVQDSLYPDVSVAVEQYRQDLNKSGYETLLYTDPIETHEELKNNLTQWYKSSGLIGAVLIGRLPYAEFYHPATSGFWAETFICDLYLMDLDGTWLDNNPVDGIFDGHTAASDADIYPEIFVSRIDPSSLSWGSGDASHVNSYLSRAHTYRTGGLRRQRRALVYIDDDWAGGIGKKWDNDVGLAYPTRTSVMLSSWTNATDWAENRLPQDYQWAHICVHSTSTAHNFGPGGFGEGSTRSNQIQEAPPSFNFYNLFACSAAKWTSIDNLGVTYAFSGNYSLAVIGTTKTGGMMDCEYFYSALNRNETLGQSLAYWFSNALNANGTAGSKYLEWYYGLTIIGDPLLTINYDCTVLPPTISSQTHPDSNAWYVECQPEFSLSDSTDVNSVIGYYYIIDRNPSTIPDDVIGFYTASNTIQVSTRLSEGIWYLHAVARDSVGNIGSKAAHFRFNIDLTAPSTEILTPVEFYNSSVNSVNIVWAAYDSLSGYVLSEVWIDSPSNIIYSGSTLNTILDDLTEGSHTFNLTVFDASGNMASMQRSFVVDLTNPALSIISPDTEIASEPDIIVEWIADDYESGYQRAEVRINDLLRATIYAPNTAVNILDLENGVHELNVTVFDWANRSISAHILITVKSGDIWQDFLPVFLVLPIGLHFFRKKRNPRKMYEP